MEIYTIMRRDCCLLGLVLLWNWQAVVPAASAQPNTEQRLELDSLVREAGQGIDGGSGTSGPTSDNAKEVRHGQ